MGFFRDVDLPTSVGIACLVLFALEVLLPLPYTRSPEGLAWGLMAPDSRAMYALGMTGGLAWTCGHLWTLLTANLLHGGVLHIFFNLSWLRSLGQQTMGYLGPARFMVIFFGGGAVGFLVSNLLSGTPTIGASSGIFALLGALAVFGRRRGGAVGQALFRNQAIYIAFGLLMGFISPNVNNLAHLGGLLGGALLAFSMPSFENVKETRRDMIPAVLLGAGALVGLVLSLIHMMGLFWDAAPRCY
jgi:rhomboid protease GluP